MLHILRRFGWTWVGLLALDDEASSKAAQDFQRELVKSGLGCLAYMEVLPYDPDPTALQRTVTVMKKSTARVVIAFAYATHMTDLMEEVGVI